MEFVYRSSLINWNNENCPTFVYTPSKAGCHAPGKSGCVQVHGGGNTTVKAMMKAKLVSVCLRLSQFLFWWAQFTCLVERDMLVTAQVLPAGYVGRCNCFVCCCIG
jgi:hypothetical protein